MSQAQDQLHQRINARIRQLEQRPPVRHFTPHYPKYHNRPFTLDCWCGEKFRTDMFDTHEIERLIDFINEHAECAPDERMTR